MSTSTSFISDFTNNTIINEANSDQFDDLIAAYSVKNPEATIVHDVFNNGLLTVKAVYPNNDCLVVALYYIYKPDENATSIDTYRTYSKTELVLDYLKK